MCAVSLNSQYHYYLPIFETHFWDNSMIIQYQFSTSSVTLNTHTSQCLISRWGYVLTFPRYFTITTFSNAISIAMFSLLDLETLLWSDSHTLTCLLYCSSVDRVFSYCIVSLGDTSPRFGNTRLRTWTLNTKNRHKKDTASYPPEELNLYILTLQTGIQGYCFVSARRGKTA